MLSLIEVNYHDFSRASIVRDERNYSITVGRVWCFLLRITSKKADDLKNCFDFARFFLMKRFGEEICIYLGQTYQGVDFHSFKQ